MKEFSRKKAILGGIAAFAALMLLIGMSFPLNVMQIKEYDSSFWNYFYVDVSENGFTMLDFDSELITSSYQWGAIVIGLLCLLQLLAAIPLFILNLVGIFCFSKKTSRTLSLVGVIVSAVFAFLYMLEGIIFTVINNDTRSGTGYTLAYLPFIFMVLIGVAYFVCRGLLRENASPQSAQKAWWETISDPPQSGAADGDPQERNAGESAQTENTAAGARTLSLDKVDAIVMSFKYAIPEERLLVFRNALCKASEDCFSRICIAPIKNPISILLLSIFLGGIGVDRFYIGDTGLGVAKLLLGGLTFGIWPLIDIFFCYKRAKEINFQTLMSVLHVPM